MLCGGAANHLILELNHHTHCSSSWVQVCSFQQREAAHAHQSRAEGAIFLNYYAQTDGGAIVQHVAKRLPL